MVEDIHPSHETYTRQPYLEIGQRVRFAGLDGQIEQVTTTGTEELPVFRYLVKYDNEEANDGRGLLSSNDLQKI